MIRQLICEKQVQNLTVLVIALRTLEYEKSLHTDATYPVSIQTTAYYVVPKETALKLINNNLFYSSDASNKNQISSVLQKFVPVIIRRRELAGRIKLIISPKQLEDDLYAVFGKYGSPMPVYRFICDQAEGHILTSKDKNGYKQIMRGIWSGRGIDKAKIISAKEMANCISGTACSHKFDFSIPNGVDPEKCIIFNNKNNKSYPSIAAEVRTAVCASFPDIADRTTIDVFLENPTLTRLIVVVKGGISDRIKLKISNFMAEYGCSNPEETYSVNGDWIGMFDFRPDCKRISAKKSDDKLTVIISSPNEFDKKCRVGSFRQMQDLSRFDGHDIMRVFAVDGNQECIDSKDTRKCITEGSEIVFGGSRFLVRHSYMKNGCLIAESDRVVCDGDSVYNFPARFAERLYGKRNLSYNDEAMFRSWSQVVGIDNSSVKVLGDEFWCDEPAFGAPCDCIKVLVSK